jgi:hypothetical protein
VGPKNGLWAPGAARAAPAGAGKGVGGVSSYARGLRMLGTSDLPFGQTSGLIHSGLQASRSAGSVGDVCRDVSGRSEHACNCVLNEAEAAASRGGRHPAMDLSACASVEDGVCDEPGLARKFRGLFWIAHACRLCAGWNQSSNSLGAHGERQRHRRMTEQRSSRGCRRSCPQRS